MSHGGNFITRTPALAAFFSGLVLLFPTALRAQALNACDLNADHMVNIVDVQLAINMALALTPCTADVIGAGVCNIIIVQRITNAALSGQCVTGSAHSAALTWTASTSSNVTGYNVYRGTQSGGPYTKLTLNLVGGTTYTDITVQAGQTYYYVTTAVDNTDNESIYSNEATAVIPSP